MAKVRTITITLPAKLVFHMQAKAWQSMGGNYWLKLKELKAQPIIFREEQYASQA